MSKSKKYFRPYLKGTDIPAIELPIDDCWASAEDCLTYLKKGNPFFNEDNYEIRECRKRKNVLDEYGDIIEVNEDNDELTIDDEPTIEDYKDTPTSDLFAIVASECQKETILSVAERYIDEQNIREFLFACMGLTIE